MFTLEGISYNWNQELYPDLNLDDKPQLGVLAQKVEKVFPEAVLTNKKGIKSVAYNMLIAPIIEAIKKLNKKIVELFSFTNENSRAIASVNAKVLKLKVESARLRKENEELKVRLNRIEKMLQKH